MNKPMPNPMLGEFKIGDVVRFKSNGLKMTVAAIYQDRKTGQPMIWCKWFQGPDGQRKLKEEGFSPDALQHLSRSSPLALTILVLPN
jgi:uncharacterized protein YodC (DUF2158 family)